MAPVTPPAKRRPPQAVSRWKVEAETTLAHSKAFMFIMTQFVDFLKSGYGDSEIAFNNASHVAYVRNDKGDVIGASVWSYDKTKRTAWILFSAVDPIYRGQGVYTALNADIERRSKNLGAVVLYSGVHIDNEPMIEAAAKSGRQLNWYRTKKGL